MVACREFLRNQTIQCSFQKISGDGFVAQECYFQGGVRPKRAKYSEVAVLPELFDLGTREANRVALFRNQREHLVKEAKGRSSTQRGIENKLKTLIRLLVSLFLC